MDAVFKLLAGFYVVLMASLVATVSGATINVTRGPYLQQGTPSSVVLRWRTDVATGSFVRYGTVPGQFTGSVSNSTLTTNHIVALQNLQPDTKYYYEIGVAGAWFPGDANDFVVTSPVAGTEKPTRIWVLGDSGTADNPAAAVRDGYIRYTGTRETDLWLMLGDNAYETGTDLEFQRAVFDMYPTFLRNSVLWPTLGNHEEDPAYFSIFTLPVNGEAGGLASGTERYYSFDYANIHFVCLDSTGSDISTNGPMCQWLRSDLSATEQDWLIAYWHHPPYSKGSHNSDSEASLTELRQNLLPILEGYGADLVLCGHSHSYERSFLLDGHYGLSSTLVQSMKKDGGDGREGSGGAYRKLAAAPHRGTVYTVAGSSGKAGGGSLNHPAMYISLNLLGSMVLDISGNRLDAVFLKTNAAAGDFFTIIKTNATSPPGAPTGLLASPWSIDEVELSWNDNASNEEGFGVERSTNGIEFVQFALVGANVTNGLDNGLSPGTTYYYRVRATNAAGPSAYSDVAQATTFPNNDGTPPSAVANLFITAITSNSISLLWTAPGDDDDAGTARRYDLRYSTNPITETNWDAAIQASGEPAPEPSGNSQAMTVRGLSAGLTFYFALKSYDEANNASPLSNVPGGTIPVPPDQTPPAAVTNLLAGNVTSNSLRLTWTATGDDARTGTAFAYDMRYSTAPITTGNWDTATQALDEPPPAAAGTSQFMTLGDLASGVTYYFALKVFDDANNASPLSNIPSATTLKPPAITNQPQDQVVAAGATAQFVVGANGTLPLSYRWRLNGTNLSNGSGVSGATTPTLTISNVQSGRAGIYSVLVSNVAGAVLSSSALLTVVAPPTLAEAVDAPELIWRTGGNQPFVGQTQTTHNGGDAAQSGPIGSSSESWLETSVTGPGTLTFWWKVSSEPSNDRLRFYRNGSSQTEISGEVDWQLRTYTLSSGNQVLRWRYTKNSSTVRGQDKAWVDQVRFLPTPPSITSQPASQTVDIGTAATFSVTANGFALRYQWRSNGVDLVNGAGVSGANTNRLMLSNVQEFQSANYSVSVSNAGGVAISSNAVLTVRPPRPPLVTTQPASQTVTVGSTASLSVGVIGSAPFIYQWFFGGMPIPDGGNTSGATSANLSIANVQTNQGGEYSVVVSNIAGGVTSSVAIVTVSTRPPTFAEAVNAPNLVFDQGGDADWTIQTAGVAGAAHDGVAAARSGVITHDDSTRFETTVTGPGSISFWWKVSCEPSNDRLRFYIDDSEQARVSGEVDWQFRSFAVPSGSGIVLRWRYSKNGSVTAGQDAGWVDQIQFTR